MCGIESMKEAIDAAFPHTDYLVHMVKNTLAHVSYKDRKAYAKDLKTIYHAASEEIAYQNMLEVKDNGEKIYPNSMSRWVDNRSDICPIFKYSEKVRRVLYTTNSIESLNSQLRRLNKNRSVFPSEQSLEKALFLGIEKITKKWGMKIPFQFLKTVFLFHNFIRYT